MLRTDEMKMIIIGSFQWLVKHELVDIYDTQHLEEYATNQKDRNYLFWQRDPLTILITDKNMSGKKLDYMHTNPLQPHWQLCKEPAEYRFSSAKFYETGEDEFNILTHLMDKL